MRLLRSPLVFVLLLCGCSSSVMVEEEVIDDDTTQPVLEEPVATFAVGSMPGTGFAQVGRNRVALIGDRVQELQDGQRYKLVLRVEEGQLDGAPVRTLLDYRKVIHLVGTLTDDDRDPAILHLRSLNERGYPLMGEAVASYKEVRAALPAHDYTRTLFRIDAVQRRDATIYEWLDYAPVAVYRCTDRSAPSVHLDLISVRPDDALLDGFIATQLGNESRMGARAVCTRDGAAYTCALENVNGIWGAARFVPGAGDAGHFDLVIDRTDDAHTKLSFACDTTDRASLSSESDDHF